MRIVVFSPNSCLSAVGVRLLSASLKQHGHAVRLVFAPTDFEPETPPRERLFPEAMLEQLLPLCEGADLIGLTLLTDYYFCSQQVTNWLNQHLDTPIVWGGVHPTVAPEECIRFADYVIVGEGEDAIVEFAATLKAGDVPSKIQSLWWHNGAEECGNPLRPLRKELDGLPLPDYELSDQYVFHSGQFQVMAHDLLHHYFTKHTGTHNPGLKVGYLVLTGRGCPHLCTYCINHVLKELYGAAGYLRWRSVENVIQELEFAKKTMPYVDYIWIADDAFFSRKVGELEEFARIYKDRIGLPFTYLTSPATLSEAKLEVLMDAGLGAVQMGVQTMSKNTTKLYKRQFMSDEMVIWAMELLNKHKDKLGIPHYDFICDNPFESRDDELETLRFIAKIPRPYFYRLFNLHLFPGTGLFTMADEQGVISRKGDLGERWHHIRTSNFSYTTFLFRLYKRPRLPAWVLRLLISRPFPNILGYRTVESLLFCVFTVLLRIKRSVAIP